MNSRPRFLGLTWQPSLGAWPEQGGIRFRVWAPLASKVEVVLEKPGGRTLSHSLEQADEGMFSGWIGTAAPGDRYRYRLDDGEPWPDPASRFQPEGVHGPSQVVAPRLFPWSDQNWPGTGLEDLVIYELHVGAFTPAGTFTGVTERLPELLELGVTAIELMPVADFPGERNWGYDGAALFAPARCYGSPDDLRRLVNSAHRLGLAVLLDVVYNHLGPDGACLTAYSPYYLSRRHKSSWGAGINLDGEFSAQVRSFFIENALHWLHEYHMDGLRIDATHALSDESPRHFLAELTARVRQSVGERRVLLFAEDCRNHAHLVRPQEEGGWGLDAVWSDDFHHQARRLLAGDSEGYFRDFTDSIADLAVTVRQGWLFTGQHSAHFGGPRGTDPTGLSPRKFVFFLQNHDQVGNRALGERLHHQIDLAAYRAASVLLLCCPASPLLFMGQEWAASTPFLYFTDHRPELGKKVGEGRRREFQHFSAFSRAGALERIPDPQDRSTFLRSRLLWQERGREPHASCLRLYQALLNLRRSETALKCSEPGSFDAVALGEGAFLLRREAPGGPTLVALIQLRGAGSFDLRGHPAVGFPKGQTWELILTTEDPLFSPDPSPPRVILSGEAPVVEFKRPTAILLRAARPGAGQLDHGPAL